MYSYTKKTKVNRRRLMVSLSCLLVLTVAFLTFEYTKTRQQDTAVFKEDSVPVLSLPAEPVAEKGRKPFKVEASVVLDYFDGKDNKVESVTEFEGVYRANQGMDYAAKNEAFDVVAVFGGKISDVKDDAVFGKSITVTSDDLKVTYQSLSETKVKKGDSVKQGSTLGKAGANIYNKDLGNHLHIVCEKNDKIIDPELIYDKTIQEIK